MNPQDKSFSSRAYRLLLRIFPGEFRGDFGSEMEEVFRDQRAEAIRRRGLIGVLALWSETILGILGTAPREHLAIFRQDAGYALRSMAKEPGYAAIAVLVLSLGIGANTALFSVLNAVLVRSLPYGNGDALLQIRQYAPKATIPEMSFSAPEIEDYRKRNQTLEELAEYHCMLFTLLGQGDTERVRTGVVSAGFFGMFGVTPVLGRDFRADDEQANAPAVLLMSYEFWRRKGSDPDIVGKVFRMNDREHTVIGVLPQMPQYPNENDVFMTTAACPFRSNPNFAGNRKGRMMKLFGRLKSGATPEQARADFAGIARRLAEEHPEIYDAENGYEVVSSPLKDEVTREARSMLWLLMGAATFVFLIACANAANLTLARLARRERELRLRSALGASNSRLFRQLVTESLIIAGLAAALGLLLAAGGMDLLRELVSRLTPRAREISLDRSAFLFAFAGAALTSVIFGSLGALSSRWEPGSGLRGWGGSSRRHWKIISLQPLLVICQIAFSFMLLIGAGLLTRSLINLWRVDPGFVRQNVSAAGVDLSWSRYIKDADRRDVIHRLLDRLRSEPGILNVAVSSGFPLDPDVEAYGPWREHFKLDGRTPGIAAAVRMVTPEYFETLGIPIVRGRGFDASDHETSALKVMVSRSFARRHWGEEHAIGMNLSGNGGEARATVIGVVGDVREFGLNRDTPDEIYCAAAQFPKNVGAVLIRSTADPAVALKALRKAITDVDPEIALTRVQTLNQTSSDSLAINTLTARLLSIFGLLALVIAVAGISGVLSLSVSRRVREIAVRRALGASATHVLGLMMRQGMIQSLIGVGLGWAGAAFLTGALHELLFDVAPTDLMTYLAISFLLITAGLVACYIPAARALRIEPHVVLRGDTQ
jgi:putative ABC transport system permease protein